jgi:hypothetical protein
MTTSSAPLNEGRGRGPGEPPPATVGEESQSSYKEVPSLATEGGRRISDWCQIPRITRGSGSHDPRGTCLPLSLIPDGLY